MIDGSVQTLDPVDVVVIGAGPGGASTAAFLARFGHSVRVLERRSLPRFHIGESLLPACMAIFERLGILERIRAQGYVDKFGAEFSFDFGYYVRVPFSLQGPGRHQQAFQVERAHFDRTFAECARDLGAVLTEQADVVDLLMEGDRVAGVRYTQAGRSYIAPARYVVDAGGRASKISRKYGLRTRVDRLKMVAIFRHFKGLNEANNPGVAGDIQVGAHRDGWVWAIPIWPDTISVGAVVPRDVLRGNDPELLLAAHAARIPRIRQRMAGATPVGELRVETDYCYYSDTIAGPGWLMVGDAACFFDPIFSGGVTLAMATGMEAAYTLDQILADPGRAPELQDRYSRFYKTGYDMYARLIYSYYDNGGILLPMLTSLGIDVQRDGVTDNKWIVRLFCGDFWSPDNEVNQILLAQPELDTFAPFDRVLECPFYRSQGPSAAGRFQDRLRQRQNHGV
jgi:FADH2-dependent halogenase